MIKLSELEAKERDKKILAYCVNLRTIAAVAAKLDLNYDYLAKIMRVLAAKGWLVRHKGINTAIKYELNKAEIEV